MTAVKRISMKFVVGNESTMERIKLIAFTHKTTPLSEIGKLHIEETAWQDRLNYLKAQAGVDELLYLSTCNRVEFVLVGSMRLNAEFLRRFFWAFDSKWTEEDVAWAVTNAKVYEGDEAVGHLFRVASSVDSLVVGEREIITQVRTGYEKCNALGLCGDVIRLVVKKTIEVAKEVYTHTNIAKNPVSVVSLAYRKLKELNVKKDARFIIIGSGVTNTTMGKYLKKHEFANFTVFNRTLANAETLAKELHGRAYGIEELKNYKEGFDIIVTCTGATGSVISAELYKSLVGDDKSRKVVIDLAIPNDLDAEILKTYDVNLIAINNLQEIAKENLESREMELEACDSIVERNLVEFGQVLKARKVEQAMSHVPKKIKEIREAANDVFANELASLDAQSKEVLDKILGYIEKKYISVPMKLAKEILLDDALAK